jgi:hypothetical protein
LMEGYSSGSLGNEVVEVIYSCDVVNIDEE